MLRYACIACLVFTTQPTAIVDRTQTPIQEIPEVSHWLSVVLTTVRH